MKTKIMELDVDFIGEQTSLSNEESKAISEYFQLKKKSAQKRKMSLTKKENSAK
ncbi:hypothetical protein [Flavobacterium silvaticum]|uniref:Uncharacterized protein n=1 Tax=Flavobacterium silvaticum TaxID=1852020 RepID=A0A972FS13_9FLAO|nr:hypothetical protein [Flavobacterium silvaticum]NMH26465.1 hypothetical protein [Flavobacterium silvaticum]